MKNCKYCETEIENHSEIGAHTRWCSKNPNRKLRKIDASSACRVCGKLYTGRRKTCSSTCAHTHSLDTKKVLSEKRKQYLKNNPDKHPWKRKDKINSVPCNNVKEFLNQRKIQYIEEYSPITDRLFSIDIAFPHIKVGIEINGNQHYTRDGKLKPYYQERHALIEQAGWRLIEVHYSQCFSADNISRFLDFDIPFDNTGIIQRYFEKKKQRETEKQKNASMPRGQKIKKLTTAKWESRKHEIFNHDIDFSKYGWVSKVATVLGISPQKINGWMKTYHPVFFKNECFTRNG